MMPHAARLTRLAYSQAANHNNAPFRLALVNQDAIPVWPPYQPGPNV